jgi:hypothetical protein
MEEVLHSDLSRMAGNRITTDGVPSNLEKASALRALSASMDVWGLKGIKTIGDSRIGMTVIRKRDLSGDLIHFLETRMEITTKNGITVEMG